MSETVQEELRTTNIKKAMQEYASENKTNVSECDFTLNSVETHVKDVLHDKFRLANEDLNLIYGDKNKILNEHVQFKQIYNITIVKATTKELSLNYSLDFGDHSDHPKIIIDPDSEIPYKAYKPIDLYLLMLQEINKIKAENSILINLFDEPMKKNLKAFINHLYAGKFTKKIRIPLFDGIEPEVTSEGKLIMWFQEKNIHSQVIEVAEGDLLVEFRKPKFGKNGLNAFGEEISSTLKSSKEDLECDIDEESIKIVEDDTKKLYRSKKKGYVNYTKNNLSVRNKININELSRHNGSVASGERNNIEVQISQNDASKDSIGEGVVLVSETIHVKGHVGAKSVLEAANLKIDGATHKDSTQFARFAEINRHKGILSCSNAKISVLEGGEVHATDVHVETSLGGSIYAQNVTINHVKNNLKVCASNSITIKLISGEDNFLKINYKEIPVLMKKLNFITKEIANLKDDLEEAIRRNTDQVSTIQNKIIDLKQAQSSIKNSSLEAKIAIEQPLRGQNTIIFTLDDGREIVFKTDARSYAPFHLKISEDSITLLPTNKTIPTK
ncbi:MAG: flagellar assembly protein A [Sulfurimonas sp.]|jgi:hypothetical protein